MFILNTLSQIPTYIPVPVISALLGACVGGAISYININRQFREQRRRDISQERKNEMIAINSVAKELEYNCIQLLNYQKYMDEFGILELYSKGTGSSFLFKQDKWIKHSDLLEFTVELEGILSDLQYFYYLMSASLSSQKISVDNIQDSLKTGHKLINYMNDIVKTKREQQKRS
ncbi:hypothetical protein [Neobacillus niacini]|uniref:hypothetical protein n=1 Tax=Neobacillus niacini TaxID=86668 RepID=UPI0021CB3D2D|nr:hypothetical protein [Neobacillus niacini]MCM3767034.1 hypothetical protein [Neobacillus niacini]